MYGSQSMVDPLRRVVVRSPDEAFGDADPQRWHYTAAPDLERARAEHAALVSALEAAGAEIVRHDTALPGMVDAIFVHDPVLVCDRAYGILQAIRRARSIEP